MICKSLFILPPHDDEEDTRERTCGAIKISTAVIILIVYIRLLDELCDILFFRDLSFITLWEFNLQTVVLIPFVKKVDVLGFAFALLLTPPRI